jgi:Flp pilus assembly pilin Flp
MKEPNLDTVYTCCLNIDGQNRSMATLSMKINKRKKNILSRLLQDERGSPLVEEGMLLGLSLIVIGIIIGLVLQVLGWSGDALGSIYQQLDQIKEQLLRLLGGSILSTHINLF